MSKPTDEQLQELIDQAGIPLEPHDRDAIVWLAQAELDRRATEGNVDVESLRPNVMRCAKCELRVTGRVDTGSYCPNGCGILWPVTWKEECLAAEKEIEDSCNAPSLLSKQVPDGLVEELRAAKQSHTDCEDTWYSCPMCPGGCADDRQEGCTCGAEKVNAALDKAIAALEGK